MALDPVTARAGLRTAREVISGRQISYPVPYMLVIVFTFSVACLGFAAYSTNAVQLVALVLACGSFGTAVVIVAIAVIFRPELLRSERHEQVIRLIDIIGDNEMDQAARTEVMTAILGADRTLRGRRGTKMGDNNE